MRSGNSAVYRAEYRDHGAAPTAIKPIAALWFAAWLN
jgi:hypothetical protein